MIDAYAHVGLPRFWSVEAYRSVMDEVGIERGLVCAFDCCTDLAEVHRAISLPGDRFRGLGLPLGRDRDEMERGIRAQLAAGFIGLRLSGADIAERPWILDLLGETDALPLICGGDALASGARNLVESLERHPGMVAIGGHFAGPTNVAVLDAGAVRDLFDHPRFNVVFSRHGHFDAALIEAWAAALLDRLGWERILWGSEAPVLIWRDAPVADTPKWIERFSPTPAQREAFFTGNAERLIFSRQPEIRPLDLPFDPRALEIERDAPMWPFGLPVDTRLCGRLVEGWIAWGGERRGPLRLYLAQILEQALPELPR